MSIIKGEITPYIKSVGYKIYCVKHWDTSEVSSKLTRANKVRVLAVDYNGLQKMIINC